MKAAFKLGLLLLFVAGVIPAPSQKQEASNHTFAYLWYPRNTDVPTSDDAQDTIVLRALLKLVPVKQEVLNAGDNVSALLLRDFVVSAQTPKAYSLYLERVRELNPQYPNLDNVPAGKMVNMPSGPRFGASVLKDRNLPDDQMHKLFLQLSGKAYFGPSNQYKLKTSALDDKLIKSLGYVFQTSKTAPVPDRSTVIRKIKDLGLVPAINVLSHPEASGAQVQPLQLTAADSPEKLAAMSELVANEKHGRLMPSSISEVTNAVGVQCNNRCRTCSDILKIPPGADMSGAHILITDTGLDTSIAAGTSAKTLTKAGISQFPDVSGEHHGTFVFSEIASSLKGPIPDSQIYVGGVATAGSSGSQFDIQSVMQAWVDYYSTALTAGDGTAKTWVANLSAEGGAAPGTVPEPAVPFYDRVLIVAAAGNEGTNAITSNNIFPRLSNDNYNLIIVGAVSENGSLASYSNHHPRQVQLFAQGDCVCGLPNQLNGTSQATPLVTVAAAVLASANPTWLAGEVMWRLLSAADRPTALLGDSFAGVVNLPRALASGIIVRSESGNPAAVSEDTGTKLTFDQEWTNSISQDGASIDTDEYILLRLADRIENNGQVCFKSIRYDSFTPGNVCVSPNAQITLSESSGAKSFTANQVDDVILTMDPSVSHNPPVIVAGSQ